LRHERSAHAALREALAEYFAARYSRAQRAAQRALLLQRETEVLRDDADFGVLARLLAAASLHRMHDGVRRDELLREVSEPGRATARPVDEGASLLAVEWAIDDRDAERAIELLAALPAGVARRTQALRLRLLAQRLSAQPLPALQTARLLAKHQAYSPAAARGLLRSLAGEALQAARDTDALRSAWQSLEPADHGDAVIAARAAACATRLGDHPSARAWLRPLWQRLGELDAEERRCVALALMDAVDDIASDWLPEIEAALQTWPNDPAIAAAAGAAYVERQLWGKARRPLEQAAAAGSLDAHARRRAWRLLAQLAHQEDDEVRAHECEHAAACID
jgi:HemY protein